MKVLTQEEVNKLIAGKRFIYEEPYDQYHNDSIMQIEDNSYLYTHHQSECVYTTFSGPPRPIFIKINYTLYSKAELLNEGLNSSKEFWMRVYKALRNIDTENRFPCSPDDQIVHLKLKILETERTIRDNKIHIGRLLEKLENLEIKFNTKPSKSAQVWEKVSEVLALLVLIGIPLLSFLLLMSLFLQ